RLVGLTHERQPRVRLRVDRDGPQPQPLDRTDDPAGDLSPVGDQHRPQRLNQHAATLRLRPPPTLSPDTTDPDNRICRFPTIAGAGGPARRPSRCVTPTAAAGGGPPPGPAPPPRRRRRRRPRPAAAAPARRPPGRGRSTRPAGRRRRWRP